jgi:hypothetical protein
VSERRFDAWLKLYPSDVMGNLRFRSCTDEVKATYLEVLALAHANEPYGHLPALVRAVALTGRSEQALRATLLALSKTGFVTNPAPDVFVVPQLVRDRQKVLAGVARQAARSGRSERPLRPSGLRAQDSEELTATQSDGGSAADASTKREPKKPRTRRASEAEMAYARAWAKHRPSEPPYHFSSNEAQAINEVWSKSGRDAAEIERRACQMFTNTDPWIRDNPVPRTLLTNWVKLGGSRPVPVDPEGFEAMNRPNPFVGKV